MFASIENLDELKVYQLTRKLGELVWKIVGRWSYSDKKNIGDQWTQSTDSISANIAEGYGRYYFNDSIKFYYYSRGSLYESYDWFTKAEERDLLKKGDRQKYRSIFCRIPKELSILIKRVRENSKNYKNNQ
jgi:four helix bundle protein